MKVIISIFIVISLVGLPAGVQAQVVAWEYCGQNPVCLMEMIYTDNRERIAKDMCKTRITQLKDESGRNTIGH